MPTAVVSQSDILNDLQRFSGDKKKLMQEYSIQMQKVVNQFGGNITDIPVDPNHPYHVIQAKLRILNGM